VGTRFFRTYTALTLTLTQIPAVLLSQASPAVIGRVTAEDGPVQGAYVTVEGTALRVLSDQDGYYHFPPLDPGPYVITVRAVGFSMLQDTVEVNARTPSRVDFQLERVPIELSGITVTGTMKEAFVSESPVTVKVVPIQALERKVTANLLESLEHVNGLYRQVGCGVCGTTNIRINGLEGAATAFLIDGMPIMGALASVYGLNGIHPAIVEQVEVLKGPSSTLYGSEALAGVVNVITKDPRLAPRLAMNAFGTSNGEFNGDFAVAGGSDRLNTLLSGSLSYIDNFIDNNGDGFCDIPYGTRAYLFGKLDYYGIAAKRLGLAAKYYHEDRVGGTEAFDKSIRGSSSIYGESIYTNRLELIGMYRLPTSSQDVSVQFSYAYHDQDSYYGRTKYDALQHIGYVNLIWNTRLAARHDVLMGGTLRYHSYDDNTAATLSPDKRFIPGVFVQDEFRMTNVLDVLGGLRLDHQADHGFIFSPRAAVKWDLSGSTTARLNVGTGFRVINLFTEDHAAYHGHRTIVIDEDLEPERTANVTFNLNQILRFGRNPMVIDADVFWTHFKNKIVHDYDLDPSEIHYYNVPGHSVSRGLGVSLSQSFDRVPLTYSLGVTVQDVYNVQNGSREDEYYAAAWNGVWSASYLLAYDIKLDYTGTIVGPMRLPAYDPPFERPTRSPTYSVHNIQATLSVGGWLDIYGGVKNLFNYTQMSPLIDPGNPFGDNFDAAYVYGPLEGRRFLVGLRMTRER
jgi:outer membrane receptor for ferrienterochelin and colicins